MVVFFYEQRLKYFLKEIFMGFDIFNPSPGNNPFLDNDEPKDDLYEAWDGLMKEWVEIEKENKLLDTLYGNGELDI